MPNREMSPVSVRHRVLVTRLAVTLTLSACVYMASLPVTGAAVRSIAFAIAAASALSLLVVCRDYYTVPSPGRLVLCTIAFWSAWSCASVTWSIDPAYTLAELRTEVGWGVLTMVIFYVAAGNWLAWRSLVATALGIAAVLASLSIALYATADVWDANALYRFHAGVSAYSTFIVLAMTLLPFVVAGKRAGLGIRRGSALIAVLLLLLSFCAARITDNRIIWFALAAALVVCGPIAAYRWRERARRAPALLLLISTALLVLLATLFAATAEQRARTDFPPETSVWATFSNDPRFELWHYLIQRIAERPLVGYGFGKSILRDQLQAALHDPLLSHAHNMFASQWLQTGAIGLAAFMFVLAALLRRYVNFLRQPDDARALIGLVGIALITSFCVKGMPDDVLNRATGKEFWALNAMLLGFGASLGRAPRTAISAGTDDQRESVAAILRSLRATAKPAAEASSSPARRQSESA